MTSFLGYCLVLFLLLVGRNIIRIIELFQLIHLIYVAIDLQYSGFYKL